MMMIVLEHEPTTGQQCKPRLRECEEQDDDGECDDAALEEEDALLELLRSPLSPWREEYSWSPQALALRELAVKTPEILKDNFIYSFFTVLRIVDKRVSVIDEGLLRFSCLEELVLSANNITTLPPENLPKTLQVLELYANHISSLKSLSTHPPPPHLQHLGLGNNTLSHPEDLQIFTADLWPQLLSLDLSWSGFTELAVVVEALSGLPRLQSLVLEGSPLTLTPSYPGFVLDSLLRLLYLDETRVTPDDRHRFNGLAQFKVCEEAEVTVCVLKMRGVPRPALPLDEFPLVSHSYSVSYEFLDHPQSQDSEQHGEEASSSCSPEDHLKTSRGRQNQAMNNTAKQEWAETIEFNYRKTHHSRDLTALKNFLLRGLWLSVEEEKVLSWPAPPEESAGTKTSADKKGKEITDMGQKSKDKKKKKESMLNLIHEPPVKHTLASVHVELKDLLEGKNQIQVKCDLGVLFSEKSMRTTVSRDKEQSKRPKEVKKEERKNISSGETSAQRTGTSSKGKGKRRVENETPSAPADDLMHSSMEPLVVEFSVQLGRVTSTSQFTNPHCSTTTLSDL
ncbi:leucine-rich repeat-containing protein 43 isoform X2 [Astyanax mexicanus]|uniref:leucine-rich repeat-containing protein 43 isoform X2 n=1 Tax=Astyanax mexicanus TaxID=7994 RepID=UPI0020CADC9E|nr:leucine-rich repeat-containing protein 43 isoform X2 [Astyanax mexicanus]